MRYRFTTSTLHTVGFYYPYSTRLQSIFCSFHQLIFGFSRGTTGYATTCGWQNTRLLSTSNKVRPFDVASLCKKTMLRFWRIISAALFVWALLLELESRPAFGFVSETRSSQCVATSKLFASVLERIAGVDWEGTCRYVDKELATAPFELQGGIRFDFGQDDDVKLTSSVVFPNGQTRTIELRYVNHASFSVLAKIIHSN